MKSKKRVSDPVYALAYSPSGAMLVVGFGEVKGTETEEGGGNKVASKKGCFIAFNAETLEVSSLYTFFSPFLLPFILQTSFGYIHMVRIPNVLNKTAWSNIPFEEACLIIYPVNSFSLAV